MEGYLKPLLIRNLRGICKCHSYLFINTFVGNAQGKYQPPEALPGHQKPFLEEKFRNGIWFQVKDDDFSVYKSKTIASTHFISLVSFYTPENIRKPLVF